MPHKKKASVGGALKGFRFDQPFIGFHTSFRTHPLKGNGKWRTRSISYGASCREEVIWDTREILQDHLVTWNKDRKSWRKTATLNAGLDIDHASLKQPGVTYLWLRLVDDDWDEYDDYGDRRFCLRPCCVGRFPEFMDAFVGTLGVMLNPDRYQGDWWTTGPSEVSPKSGARAGEEYRWYGMDNFFLRHPVLVSIVLGMFRQGVLLFEQGFDEAALRAVRRKDVEDALTNSDPKLAMQILTKLRPWIEAPANKWGSFPFVKGQWSRLGQLHRAAFNHGYDEVFGEGLSQSWNIAGTDDVLNDRYSISTGPVNYWGGFRSHPLTEEGKKLAKLGR